MGLASRPESSQWALSGLSVDSRWACTCAAPTSPHELAVKHQISLGAQGHKAQGSVHAPLKPPPDAPLVAFCWP